MKHEQWEVTDNGFAVFKKERNKDIAFDGQICRLHTGLVTYKNNEYNSKLIASAPDLLEALEHTLEVLYKCDCPPELHETYGNLFMNYNNLINEIKS